MDLLFVGVQCGKGVPCDELTIKHNGRGIYAVSYKANERGNAFIHVLYGGKHVPGSPFALQI
jgi:filamin